MALMMDLAVAFSSFNILILLGLLYVYARIVWRSKAVYPTGLMIFSLLLLLQNALTVYSYLDMTPFFNGGVLPYLLTISVLEFGGLLALVRVTL